MSNDPRLALVFPDRHEHGASPAAFRDALARLTRLFPGATCIPRARLTPRLDEFDLVLTAGGDGTLLDAAQYLTDTPICGIRLFPGRSVGYLCTLDADALSPELADALPDHPRRPLMRFECLIDGIPSGPPFLNDLLMAHACPARASRYRITLHDASQTQCSSGVWIATPSGSHAATAAAGAPPLPAASPLGLLCVRELCRSSATPPLRTATFSPDCPPTLEPCAANHRVFLDGGLTRFDLHPSQILSVRRAPHPIQVLHIDTQSHINT